MSRASNQRKTEQYQVANLKAASIIAADPEKYPAGSLLAIWAAMVLNLPEERTGPAIGEAA